MQEEEAPAAAGKEVPPTSDVQPASLDDPQIFTSWRNREELIRNMLAKGPLPPGVSEWAHNPYPAVVHSSQGELSLRRPVNLR